MLRAFLAWLVLVVPLVAHAAPGGAVVSGKVELPSTPPDRPPAQVKGFLERSENQLAPVKPLNVTSQMIIVLEGNEVANFTGQRLSHLCGARAATCPPGAIDGAISPDTGYPFDGLQRNTGVQVDPSGNVWLTNNWIKFPVQTDPFGDGLVVYLGMAAPVRTPLIGTPQRP